MTKNNFCDLKKFLEKRLNPNRYYHSLCVADEALRLAEKYGCDQEKAYLAGLLHDITKNSDKEEHLHIFDSFGIILSDIEMSAEKLWHAISGAAFVKNILQIDDENIINAIRYHTTAHANMNLLEKIIYLADFISQDRNYDDVDVIRNLVDESLEKALCYALTYSIKDLLEKGRAIHPDTVSAYNDNVMKGI